MYALEYSEAKVKVCQNNNKKKLRKYLDKVLNPPLKAVHMYPSQPFISQKPVCFIPWQLSKKWRWHLKVTVCGQFVCKCTLLNKFAQIFMSFKQEHSIVVIKYPLSCEKALSILL